MPVTTPVELMVATDALDETHVPVPPSDNVVELPTHAVLVPVIAPGTGKTVIVVVAETPPHGFDSR
jgi:hypothetical protein